METITKFEVTATSEGNEFKLEFDLPGVLTESDWEQTKVKLESLLNMMTKGQVIADTSEEETPEEIVMETPVDAELDAAEAKEEESV